MKVALCMITLFGVGSWLIATREPAPPIFDQKLPVVKETAPTDRQPAKAEADKGDEDEDGALSFWNSELIVGEGPNRGKIELLAIDGKKSVVLTADKDGVVHFDSLIPKEKEAQLQIKLGKRGQAPVLTFLVLGETQETKMHAVYRASEHVKAGKITPFILPGVLPIAERLYRQEGEHLQGYTWHLSSYDVQVYGKERKKDPTANYGNQSDDVEQTPLVKADFNLYAVDLSKRYFTPVELVKMAEEDKNFEDRNQKNYLKEIKTSKGTFRCVTSYDRYSVNPEAKFGGGMAWSSLQLPNGKWLRDALSIEKAYEVDGAVYLIGRYRVFKWNDDESLECVVSFEGSGRQMPYISPLKTDDGMVAGKYFPVNKSNDSEFGGLLEYREGQWLFHQYDGDYGTWVDSFKETDGQLTLVLFNGWKDKPARQISFDLKQKKFTDL